MLRIATDAFKILVENDRHRKAAFVLDIGVGSYIGNFDAFAVERYYFPCRHQEAEVKLWHGCDGLGQRPVLGHHPETIERGNFPPGLRRPKWPFMPNEVQAKRI